MWIHLNRLQINAEVKKLVVDSFACLDRELRHALYQVINYDQEPAVCCDLWPIFTHCYGFKCHFYFVLTSPSCWSKSSSAFVVYANSHVTHRGSSAVLITFMNILHWMLVGTEALVYLNDSSNTWINNFYYIKVIPHPVIHRHHVQGEPCLVPRVSCNRLQVPQ